MNNSKTLILYSDSSGFVQKIDNRAVANAAFDHRQVDAAKGKDDEDLDFANNILPDQGEMTRDALAQLLLCYIGTAANTLTKTLKKRDF